MHLGQESAEPLEFVEAATPVAFSLGGGPGAGRFDMAAIAALTTCTVGGLIPQARHGGIGVREASAGSKLEGTGLENEHIGHTQVALAGGAGAGLPCRGGVLEEEPSGVGGSDTPRESCFKGLGYRVIFAEDLRKPACNSISELARACQKKCRLRRIRAFQRP